MKQMVEVRGVEPRSLNACPKGTTCLACVCILDLRLPRTQGCSGCGLLNLSGRRKANSDPKSLCLFLYPAQAAGIEVLLSSGRNFASHSIFITQIQFALSLSLSV